MELAHIPLQNLSISPANMRHAKKDPDISDILPSVRTRGVLVPLLVRPKGSPETYEIVAGRRRFFAARAVAAEGGRTEPLPCGILAEGDDANALEASLIENIHRLDPDEMSQYETFAKLIKTGKTPEDIAATFGLTPRQVAQRLALGNLLPAIRVAYRNEEIDATSVQVLTLATKRQQLDWLKLFQTEEVRAPFGHHLKQWLMGGQTIPTSLALFTLDGLKDHIAADLFGEESYFRDADMFWKKQNEAIAARQDTYLAAGWSEVVILDKGDVFQTWDHEKRAKKKGGKVFIAISQRGEVTFHEGYVTRNEARRKDKEKTKSESAQTATARPEVSSALQTYIDFHRHAAVRAALLDKPGVALRLLAAHALCGSRLWKVSPEPQRSGREDIDASVQNSPAHAAFITARQEMLSLLELPEGAGLAGTQGDSAPAIFARLLSLGDKDVRRLLTVVMAESLEAGSAMVEAAGMTLGVDLQQSWLADETFFALVRDKAVVSAMLADVAGKAVANANLTATGKVQKDILKDYLTGTNGRAKVDGWLPRWLEFPARGYRKEGGFKTANDWKGIRKLFHG
ncbi:MAG: ParB/RepB/Spo0J family partition protein [Rhodospirillaceae bacterium]